MTGARGLSPAARRRRTVVRALTGTVVFGAVLVGGAVGVAALLDASDAPDGPVRCAAEADGTAWYLEPDQAETAALLAGTSLQRRMPARAASIAIATGLQESKLRNIDYGDRDSLGIFQQRPSQGWGSEAEVQDPVYATNAFYDELVTVEGYEQMPITEAAQAVQRSGYPDAYAQHEVRSRAWASALTGHSPGALTCTLPEATGTGDPTALAARLERDLGLVATVDAAGVVTVDVAGQDSLGIEPARAGWAVAQWSVAVAGAFEVVDVQHGDQRWLREEAAWSSADDGALPEGQVRISLAG